MKIQIFKSGWITFANADYVLNMIENNRYLSYDNEKTIKYRSWIYNDIGKNKNFIEISKKPHNKIFTK